MAGDSTTPLMFSARFLPMGAMQAVEECGVELRRLRGGGPPGGSTPHDVYQGGNAQLREGALVQVQWKGRKNHPFGWWLATVQAISGGGGVQSAGEARGRLTSSNSRCSERQADLRLVQACAGARLTLLFRQYPLHSVWRRVRASLQVGKEAALVNGDCRFG